MESTFCHILSELRRQKGYSQRKVAADLGISQALLSHYENGAREPGLNFVCRACDYYEVTADYVLGRTAENGRRSRELQAVAQLTEELRALTGRAEQALAELEDAQA